MLDSACHRPAPAEQAVTLTATITEIRTQFPDDPSAEQADDLEKPAKRAAKAYANLLELAAQNPQDSAVAAAQAQVEPLYSEIRRAHRLATERRDLGKLVGSLKVRGYRAARTVVVPKLLATLAAAARQAADTDLEKLPKLVREAAELAASFAGVETADPAGSTAKLSRADWLRAAERIDAFNQSEPPEVALGLGLAYAALGKGGFALVELERVDPAKLGNPEHAALVPLARAFTFSRFGFIELAAREASLISGDTETGRQLLAATHAVVAYLYGAEKDWKQMDRELGQAVRAWPNNPLVIFLSGERLLADGRREQALETFARAAAGTDGAWLAPLVEQRLREVRDSKGEVPPLVLDNELVVKGTLHLLVQQARQSEAGRRLAGLLESARLLPAALGENDK